MKERSPELDAQRDREDAFLVRELRKIGFKINTVFDFYNYKVAYPPGAIEKLLSLLHQVDDTWMKQGVLFGLCDRRAQPMAARPLIEEYHARGKPQDPKNDYDLYRSAIGGTLAVVADNSVFDELCEIIADQSNGWSRCGLLPAFRRMKKANKAKVIPLLIELLEDEQMCLNAIQSLGNLRSVEAYDLITPFLDYHEAFGRNRAKAALAKLDREIAKRAAAKEEKK